MTQKNRNTPDLLPQVFHAQGSSYMLNLIDKLEALDAKWEHLEELEYN